MYLKFLKVHPHPHIHTSTHPLSQNLIRNLIRNLIPFTNHYASKYVIDNASKLVAIHPLNSQPHLVASLRAQSLLPLLAGERGTYRMPHVTHHHPLPSPHPIHDLALPQLFLLLTIDAFLSRPKTKSPTVSPFTTNPCLSRWATAFRSTAILKPAKSLECTPRAQPPSSTSSGLTEAAI